MNLGLLKLFIVLCICSAQTAYAQCEHLWFMPEVGFGPVGGTEQKTTQVGSVRVYAECYGRKYGLEISRFSKGNFFASFHDRRSGESSDLESYNVAIFKHWGRSSDWGYRGYSLGLGLGETYKVSRCTTTSGFWGDAKECDIDKVAALGIPLQASAILGRYVGVGVSAQALFLTTGDVKMTFRLSVPIGKFNN